MSEAGEDCWPGCDWRLLVWRLPIGGERLAVECRNCGAVEDAGMVLVELMQHRDDRLRALAVERSGKGLAKKSAIKDLRGTIDAITRKSGTREGLSVLENAVARGILRALETEGGDDEEWS